MAFDTVKGALSSIYGRLEMLAAVDDTHLSHFMNILHWLPHLHLPLSDDMRVRASAWPIDSF